MKNSSRASSNSNPGFTFTNTVVLTAGFNLNEVDFPPHGGVNVGHTVFPNSPVSIEFDSPVESFSAYFSYNTTVTLSAYDGLTLLGSVTSLITANFHPSVTPNELIQLTGLGAFTRATLAGAPGGFFTFDDLTAVPVAGGPTPVPEPNGMLLALAGIVLLALARRSPARRSRH